MTALAAHRPVQCIVDLLQPVLLFFHDTVGVGWGMSIVLLTVRRARAARAADGQAVQVDAGDGARSRRS